MKIILFILSLVTCLHAQKDERTCRTLFLNGPQQAASNYYLFDGVKSVEVEFPRLNLSPVYKFDPALKKLWLTTAPITDIEDIPAGSPEVIVPAGAKDMYLLIVRDPANNLLPLRMLLVNANQDRIGKGETLWFNLTSKYIFGKLGKQNLKLPARKTVLVKPPISGKGSYHAELYFRVKGDRRTHPLLESKWRHNPRVRKIAFIFNEGRRRAPRMQSFVDFRMPVRKKVK